MNKYDEILDPDFDALDEHDEREIERYADQTSDERG